MRPVLKGKNWVRNRGGRLFAIVLFLLLPWAGCRKKESTDGPLLVSAASDLTEAFDEIGRLFTGQTGVEIRFNFGSTGQLAQQIELGAPVDIFAAASLDNLDELERKGRLLAETRRLYAIGQLAIWQQRDQPVPIRALGDLRQTKSGQPFRLERLAIANPEHAPYGKAAREALINSGLWDEVQPRLVIGENVRQARQYAESGDVGVAIIARSLCGKSGTDEVTAGRCNPVPTALHQPLQQGMAIVSGSRHFTAARQFIDLVTGEEGRAILTRYGFELPPQPSTGKSP